MDDSARTKSLSVLAARSADALLAKKELSVVLEFAREACERINNYKKEQGRGPSFNVRSEDLSALFTFFDAICEASDPRAGSRYQLTLQRKPGRPKLDADQQYERALTAQIADDYSQGAFAGDQIGAIRKAIEEVLRLGLAQGLTVRKVERALQEQRRLKREE